jgi:hypothetical protein
MNNVGMNLFVSLIVCAVCFGAAYMLIMSVVVVAFKTGVWPGGPEKYYNRQTQRKSFWLGVIFVSALAVFISFLGFMELESSIEKFF